MILHVLTRLTFLHLFVDPPYVYINKKTKRSDTYFGVAQDISGETSSEVAALLAQSKVYMSKVVNVDPQYSAVRADCRNHEALCTFWATIGECDGNPAYMKLHCAPACQSCEQLDINVRCPLDPNVEDWLGPGDLDALFERMVADPYYNRQYQLTVISRPSHPPDSTEAERMDANYTIGPWMVTFDNFLSPEEADTIIELGAQEGYVRSTDVGKRNFDGTYGDHRSSQRTSENSWCQNECYDNPITQTVLSRIENLTGIPDENSEYLQLLKYEEGQFYGVHNDFIEYQVDRPVGSRILTFYMYLNDVEEGGGTRFPQVGGTGGTTVIPKRGRAVLWPSVLNENPNRKDHRTEHEAMPVIRGVKYGANAWIHNRNFKGPNENGCS